MKVRVLDAADIAACPKHSFKGSHYLSDGTCLCSVLSGARDEALKVYGPLDQLKAEQRRVRRAAFELDPE